MDPSDQSVDDQTAVTAPPIACENFQRRPSAHQIRLLKSDLGEYTWDGPPYHAIYAGIALSYHFTSRRVTLAVAVRDSSYMLDYAQHDISSGNLHPDWAAITDHIIVTARENQHDHAEKFISLAMSTDLAGRCPDLCARLWLELDIIPIVLRKVEEKVSWGSCDEQLPFKSLDEQAESMARKCIRQVVAFLVLNLVTALFLLDVGDTDAVAEHLFQLWTNQKLYDRMSEFAPTNVSDKVGTVGNLLSWLYLASELSKGRRIQPNERLINDMAREEANQPYQPLESRLKRALHTSEAK
ncbi:hypothetical protein FOCG_18246 [Fusarium oxysporum f. sp. radicis-lycopersici 26381]|nr:hypothetical protein FOCG_18246 [Fusarium oxysporum f. sp. radicis-lycopersici 26381]WKT54116.1 hypothetical protein QSH57_004700 [Fusarium oxysporum f. sp. vasinfectum]